MSYHQWTVWFYQVAFAAYAVSAVLLVGLLVYLVRDSWRVVRAMTRTWIDRRLCLWCERETDCEVRAAHWWADEVSHLCLHCLRWSVGGALARDPLAYRAASA